ncbi:uncharacterized protein LOC100212861 [Hydra vulgaris]|uniref:Presequence translocated-associated motor subunit PAM17, mitochondrial n=1 Tax=Hydra vulgaris TaxID=6087 RepID=A0ABM4CYL9_HYDVU
MAALKNMVNFCIKQQKVVICFYPVITKHMIHSSGGQMSSSAEKYSALSFDEYQSLKRSLRTKQRLSGIPFAFTGLTISSMATAYLVPDMFDATPENVQLIMGLDPIVFCGICGVSSSFLGYVLGTNFYKLIWILMNKNEAMRLQEKDKDFLKRLEKHRFSQDSKFEDDYYGESIKTLSDYRQWVRTQQRKREAAAKFKIMDSTKLT